MHGPHGSQGRTLHLLLYFIQQRNPIQGSEASRVFRISPEEVDLPVTFTDTNGGGGGGGVAAVLCDCVLTSSRLPGLSLKLRENSLFLESARIPCSASREGLRLQFFLPGVFLSRTPDRLLSFQPQLRCLFL